MPFGSTPISSIDSPERPATGYESDEPAKRLTICVLNSLESIKRAVDCIFIIGNRGAAVLTGGALDGDGQPTGAGPFDQHRVETLRRDVHELPPSRGDQHVAIGMAMERRAATRLTLLSSPTK